MLGFEIGGVGGEEAQEGEEGLPEERPVVEEMGAGKDEIGDEAVNEAKAGDVEGEVKAAAEIVV